MSTLYIVATPIGNLEDITLRALRVLKEVDTVLCEDTRVTKKLLSHYDIHTPTVSYHSQSSVTKEEHVLDLLETGKDLALVSDAGTPTISDPGARLVSRVLERFGDGTEAEVRIEVIPGASSLTAALSVAGVPASEFLFLGFLPHKKGRETLFEEIASSSRTVVFFESPHRIMKTLGVLYEKVPTRQIAVCRELTKIYEEVVRGTVAEVREVFTQDTSKVRGEFVVVVNP